MTDLNSLKQRQEPLDVELQKYLVDSILGPVIKHPLVFSIPHSPQLNAMANQWLRAKQDRCHQAAETQQWEQFLFLHERPFRVHAFAGIAAQLNDQEYWPLLADLWIDAENIYEDQPLWTTLLQDEARIPSRHLMMNDTELRGLACQAETLRVYRGFNLDGRQEGMSWTLRAEVARRFARRFGGNGQPRVAAGTVCKATVIAYLCGRREHEIIVNPSEVQDVTVVDI